MAESMPDWARVTKAEKVAVAAERAGFTQSFSGKQKDPSNPDGTKWIIAATDADLNGQIIIMVAIAYAESSLNRKAISKTGDYGIWQINKKAHPELFQKYAWDNVSQNAQMAKAVYDKQGYSAWVAYNSGAYKKYIKAAQKAVNRGALHGAFGEVGIREVTPGEVAVDVTEAVALDPIGKIITFIRDGASVVGLFLLGLLVIGLGLWAVLRNTEIGKAVGSVTDKVTDVVPQAKAVKTIKKATK